jgi:arylsulfatase A-like enzyme
MPTILVNRRAKNECTLGNVPILATWPGAPGGTAVTRPVEMTQIAPTILKLLGLNPHELHAVLIEGTQPLF